MQITSQPDIKTPILFGAGVLAVFFLLFLVWGTFASVDTAAVAQGSLISQSYRKTIQSLEGGLITQIYVQNGDVVTDQQPLIKLDDVSAKASYNDVHLQAQMFRAAMARLEAQRDGKQTIEWPDVIKEEIDQLFIKQIVDNQTEMFNANVKNLTDQYAILQERMNQTRTEIKSIQAQVAASDTQLKYIQKELKAVQHLDALDLIDKPRLYSLKREEARLKGLKGQQLGSIAKAEQNIGETQQQMIALQSQYQKQTMTELTETRARLLDAYQKEQSTYAVLQRTLIRSPQNGSVMGLTKHTIGGVISPGEAIMDIVPADDQLIVEVKISPLNIDAVRPGLPAKIRLSALKARETPFLLGHVTHVSADSFLDKQSNVSYYIAQIQIDKNEISKIPAYKLYPGMPVEAMIIVEKRSPLKYLLSPLTDSFNRAFKEK